MKKILLSALYRASLCREFENKVYDLIIKKKITFPVYFSAGQEYVACSIGAILKHKNIKPMLLGNIVVIQYILLLEEILKNLL